MVVAAAGEQCLSTLQVPGKVTHGLTVAKEVIDFGQFVD